MGVHVCSDHTYMQAHESGSDATTIGCLKPSVGDYFVKQSPTEGLGQAILYSDYKTHKKKQQMRLIIIIIMI